MSIFFGKQKGDKMNFLTLEYVAKEKEQRLLKEAEEFRFLKKVHLKINLFKKRRQNDFRK